MSMMQMLMASHISEGLGDVPPLPIEVERGLTAKVEQGLAVRRAVREVLTPMGSQQRCIFSTEQLSYSLEQPITAVRAWLIDNAGEGHGEPVITGLAFRYRDSDRFIPDAPDAGDDAFRRGRDPQTFREQTETLAAGESIVAVKCSSTSIQFTSQITLTTSQGRDLVFGSLGTIVALPWGPPDEFSAGGAPLIGFIALRKLIAPWMDWQGPDGEAWDIYGGATLVPMGCYFSNAWNRRRHVVVLKALCKKGKAKPTDALWRRVLDLEEGHWRYVVRCL